MVKSWKSIAIQIFFVGLMLNPAGSLAADFELFWDANCNKDPALEGYYIHYMENASVVDAPSGAVGVYVALTDIYFDPDNPSLLIAGLRDGVRYCFAVTAWYGDEESSMSNEVCGINGTSASDPDPDLNLVADAGGPYEVTDTDDSGSQAVTLDGSASSDSNGTITSYQWFENGTLIGTGVNPTLSFSVGTHTVILTVTNNDNATHSNDTNVIVNPAPNAAPKPDSEPEPTPGINSNPGLGITPEVTNLSGDGLSSGCFITHLK